MTQLLLSASGKENLKFQSALHKAGECRLDLNGAVRFGVLGEPVTPDKKQENR